LFFHYWREGKRPANFAVWKIVNNKMRLYLISDVGEEFKKEGGDENNPVVFKNVISKILLSHKDELLANGKFDKDELSIYEDIIIFGEQKFVRKK
jgi:hypothetical protein